MNKTNKGFNYVNILYFIVAFLIVFLFGYIVYTNFIEIKGISSNTSTTSLNETQLDTLGKDKFNWLNGAVKKQNNYPVFFTNESLDSSNFSNNDLLTISYDALTNEDKNGTGTTDNTCFHDELGNNTTLSNYPEKCYKETFDTSVLKEQVNKYFTSNIVPQFNDFNPSGSKACFINNNSYNCILNVSKIDIAGILIITGYDHVEQAGDNLIVYSKLLTVKRELDIFKKEEQGIYSDLDGTNKIDDLTYYSEATSNGLTSESKENIINKYSDKITTYKTTFSKNSSSDYVWVSTEKTK